MNITHEALLKGLIKHMVFDACDSEQKLLLSRLNGKDLSVNDLTEAQKNVFRKLVHSAKNEIAGYVEHSSRRDILTDWEIII